MNVVVKISIFLLCLMFQLDASAQNISSKKLKQQQSALEKKINASKSLLSKMKQNTKASLDDLRLLENQIRYRERLLSNYDNQIRSAELTIEQKEKQIIELKEKVVRLKEQYRKLLLYAYKKRSQYNKLMYVFTSKDFNEARRRNNYLKKLAEIQKKQFVLIQQNQELIADEIKSIDSERKSKLVIVDQKRSERAQIEEDRLQQKELYEKFKSEENELLAELKKNEEKKIILRNKIQAAIKREIAAAEAERKRELARLEAERKAKAEREAAATGTTTIPTTKPTEVDLASTKELALVSANFESNRGRLPWPVGKGVISEKFGKNAHPSIKNVYTNNRGIDITSPKNAQVRSIFGGEVTSVLNIPGAGKVVIIKHGNYRTVYSNLQDTYVKAGDKVNTKTMIGSLLSQKGKSNSILHFEVHKVVGSSVNCLNPSLWIVR